MNNILFKTEEENEFIPLFSFNEQDMENEPALEMEEMIPILPLRNTVLFPGVVIPITVGRDKSIQAVKAAFGKDKLIGVVSQMDGNIEDPTAADLCKIGTVAKVIKMIKMQDGGTTIIIQGKKRFELIEMVEVDPFFKAKVAIIEEETILKEDQNFQALLATIKDLATQIIQMSPNFPSEAAMILKNIESPLFLI
ncbi:MAG: LON peptidase substrate-binding domain-containing protein, partial [Chitinophagaceae bacterium]